MELLRARKNPRECHDEKRKIPVPSAKRRKGIVNSVELQKETAAEFFTN